MRRLLSVPYILYLTFFLFSFQSKQSYTFFTKKGKETSYKKFLQEVSRADIILFGELHDNEVAHQIQYNLLKDLYRLKGKNVAIGAEMFEADDQIKIDELTGGVITMSAFEHETKLWNNFEDYKPLLEFAAEKDLRFVASNIPRRYANLVARKGLSALDSLSGEALKFVAPLPLDITLSLPGYEALKSDYMHAHGGMIYMAEAQAVKDATMAHFILKNFTKGKTFLHINGAYHSDNYEGIYWMLKKKNPELNIVTVSTVVLKENDKPSDKLLAKADFLLAVREEEKLKN
jgi:uncharacterized iron-regulated protein